MPNKTLRVLNVEDSERDVALLTRHLNVAGYELFSERVETARSMKAALEAREWDIILCDYSMPRFDALQALTVLRQSELDIPFIIISGTVGEDVAVKAMLTGADDYLPKNNLTRLVPAIEREMHQAENRREQKRTKNERRVVFEIIQGSIATPNLDEFLKLVHRSIGQVAYAENCYVMLHDPAGDMMHFKFWVDKYDPVPPPIRVGRGFSSYVLRTGRPLLLTDEARKRLLDEGEVEQIGSASASWLGVPLRTPSATIGVLAVGHYEDKHAYSQHDVEFLSSIGNQIALAIERKRAGDALGESEERYRSVVETAPDVIVTIDESSIIRFVNPAAERVFGHRLDAMRGAPLTMLMPEYLRHLHKAGIERYQTTGKKHVDWADVELTGLHSSGREIPITLSFSEFFQNGHRYFTGIIRDISERKKATEALAKSEERYRDLVENAIDMIFTLDLDGNFTGVNRASEDIIGYTREEALKMNTAELVAPEYRDKAANMIAEKLAGREVVPYDLEVIAKDGRRIIVEISVRIIYEKDVPVGVHGIARDITERKRNGDALRENEYLLSASQRITHQGSWVIDLSGSDNTEKAKERWSDEHYRIFGFEPGQVEITDEIFYNSVHPDDRDLLSRTLREAIEQHKPFDIEHRIILPDGSERTVQATAELIFDTDTGQPLKLLGSIQDITDRKHLEEQFRQSQKMEAVGALAGGIAHDFNNLLTAINGYSDLTLKKMPADDPLRSNINEVREAGHRAAELTAQLLAFSRKQVLKPRVYNLNAAITEIDRMLRRIMRENIELRTALDPDLGNIKADAGQIEQVIMNLAVNARDAMPDGGTLTIETRNVHLDDAYMSQHLLISPGKFVRMTVTDTGHGMDEEVQRHIFEPFFTTKDVGKGTGLGLSTVYGIIKQSGGDIMVYSEVGHGTTFKVYLPCVDQPVEKPRWVGDSEEKYSGTETILLVEDEEIVRNLVCEVLTGNGYTVLEAASGKAALSVCDTYPEPIHMLLTDVIMPKMSGNELRDLVIKSRPEIKVLFMSGYTDDAMAHRGLFDSHNEFIEKPFTPDGLSRKVREVLEY